MSTYVITVDFGSGAVDVSNLVRYKSIKKTQTIHRGFKSTMDTLSFQINLTSLIASYLLSADDFMPVVVTKDGSDYFKGVIRPTTTIKSNNSAEYIDFTCLDMGYKLESILLEDIAYYSYTLSNPTTTATSIVHSLLLAAGYELSDIGTIPTISETVLVFEEQKQGNSYFSILDDLLFVYGYVFYFDDSGEFNLYKWSEVSPSSTGTADATNILSSSVDIKKDDIDFDSVILKYNVQGKIESKSILTVDTGSVYSPWPTAWNSGKLSYSLKEGTITKGISRSRTLIKGSKEESSAIKVEDYITQFDNLSYTITAKDYGSIGGRPYIWTTPVTTSGLSVGDSDVRGTYTLTSVDYDDDGITIVLTFTQPLHDSTEQKATIEVIGDYYYSTSSEKATYPELTSTDNFIDPIEVSSIYTYNETIATTFVQSLYERRKAALLKYTFSSEDDFSVGEYVALSLPDLGLASTQVRIVKKITTEQDQRIKYMAEGNGAIGTIADYFVSVGLNTTASSSSDVNRIISTIDTNMNAAGLTTPLAGFNLEDLAVVEADLYMTKYEMGFYDGTDWTVHIDNTGDFLFKGDASNQIEWDGSKLSVTGDLYLSGDSTLQGTITAGNGIESPNFVTGVSGWQINGDGDAEFQDITARGTVYMSNASQVNGTIIASDGIVSSNFATGVSGWRITGAGVAEFQDATIVGTIEASAGDIGGWTIEPGRLITGTGVTRISLDPTGGISMGNDTFALAPFSVTNAGVLKAQSGTIANWTISTDLIKSTAQVGATKYIELDSDLARIAIREDATSTGTKVAMGYLGGLSDFDGGTLTAGTYGFWVNPLADALVWYGDGVYEAGDFIFESDASIVLRATAYDPMVMGTITGGKRGIEFTSDTGDTAQFYSDGSDMVITDANFDSILEVKFNEINLRSQVSSMISTDATGATDKFEISADSTGVKLTNYHATYGAACLMIPYDWGAYTSLIVNTWIESQGFIANEADFGKILIDGILLEESAFRTGILEINKSGSAGYVGIGLSFSATSSFNLMGSQSFCGLYDDYNDKWAWYHNATTGMTLCYNGSAKLTTTNTGITVNGSITLSGGVLVGVLDNNVYSATTITGTALNAAIAATGALDNISNGEEIHASGTAFFNVSSINYWMVVSSIRRINSTAFLLVGTVISYFTSDGTINSVAAIEKLISTETEWLETSISF